MTNEELVNLIYISIETEGADFQKLCDLVDVTGVGMREEPEKRATYFKVSNYAADYARYMYGQGNGEKFELLFQKAKCNEAPFYFDSYLQYLEHRRIYENRFYEPRRDCLLKIGVIQAMQDLEDDKLDILCISMPPGSGKTTLEKFFASWVIGRHPDDYSLFFSHSGDITRMFYDGVLDITNNPVEYAFNDVFPDVQYTQKGSNAKMESLNFNKYKPFANLQCTSIGSKNAGKVRCNQYLYCDDLIGGIEEALNKAYLAKLWGIYTTDAKQRKVPKMDGRPCKEIHIATRWSTMDVIGRLQAVYGEDPRAKFIAIPDIDEETGESNFMYEVGGMSTQFFNDIALTMDDISYQCLYKNKPIEREGLLYTDEEVRRYLTLPLDPPDAIVGVCDTKRTGTDYFVMVCFAQYGMDFYLLDVVCDNTTNYDLQYEKCTALILENKMQQMQFESNQGGDRVALEVAKRVDERNGICNITTKHTQENKETKIIINADWIKKHCLFKDKSLIVRKSDYDIFMKQLFSYSTVGKNNHDDVPDALAMFAMYMNNLMAPANKVEIISRALLGI